MRMNKIILVAGTRGTGKTQYLKKVLHASTQPKKLIVDTFDSDVWRTLETHDHPEWSEKEIPLIESSMLKRWKVGTYRIGNSNIQQTIKDIEDFLLNAFVIFEDATKYVGSRLNDDMKRFVLDSKQKNLDFVFVFHSLAQIPNDLIRIADVITLFKTNEDIPSKKKYPFPAIPELMDLVKKNPSRYFNASILLN
jgi:phage terminase large subunit-like protein